MRLVSLFLCITLGTAINFIFSMDVLISEEDPGATLRALELHASYTNGPKVGNGPLVARKIMTDERQPLIKREWTEDEGSNTKECRICESKYNKKTKVKLKLLCDSEKKVLHAFCKECLTAWTEKKQTCPTCSRPFVLSEILKEKTEAQVQTPLYSSIKKTILKWCCCTYFIDN